MKAITKFLFVALLIGVALNLPTKVRAGGTNYTCDNWPAYGECYGQLQTWMNQCAQDCTQYAGMAGTDQYCYTVETTSWNTDTNTLSVSDATTCWATELSGASCISSCVNGYHSGYWGCIDSYCTPD